MSQRAKALRSNGSPVERRMWRILFTFRTGGYHFRKQVQIGPYVVDMACHHAKLVIEVDGDTHGTDAAQRQDARRDAFLRGEGYEVLRIPNAEVVRNPDGVFLVVEEALRGRPRNRRSGHPLPNPPHKGEGVPPTSPNLEGSAKSGNNPRITSPLVGEVAQLGPQVRSGARRGAGDA